ncbi:hypothetical protein PG985_009743 [Apiospora marii]|uniref:uncharacterized protein n=1 Tax=Apiospora marii TaxID=335849 RepID=UPI00312FC964
MASHQSKRAASPIDSGRRIKARPEDPAQSGASLDQPTDPNDEQASEGLSCNGFVLSTEIELLIFKHLDTNSLRSLCLTSKYFRKIVMGEYFRVIALSDSPKTLSSTIQVIQRQPEGWFNHVQ